MEFVGKGVMDVRILHRFGPINSGFNNLFGLDQANMRFGFDYGITKKSYGGLGRSNVGKEWDGFIKFRPIWQAEGGHMAMAGFGSVGYRRYHQLRALGRPYHRKNFFTSRMAFYNEIIIGRKFRERFSLQVSPTFVHRNIGAHWPPMKTIFMRWVLAPGSNFQTYRICSRLSLHCKRPR